MSEDIVVEKADLRHAFLYEKRDVVAANTIFNAFQPDS
jgi:hypothetical protein